MRAWTVPSDSDPRQAQGREALALEAAPHGDVDAPPHQIQRAVHRQGADQALEARSGEVEDALVEGDLSVDPIEALPVDLLPGAPPGPPGGHPRRPRRPMARQLDPAVEDHRLIQIHQQILEVQGLQLCAEVPRRLGDRRVEGGAGDQLTLGGVPDPDVGPLAADPSHDVEVRRPPRRGDLPRPAPPQPIGPQQGVEVARVQLGHLDGQIEGGADDPRDGGVGPPPVQIDVDLAQANAIDPVVDELAPHGHRHGGAPRAGQGARQFQIVDPDRRSAARDPPAPVDLVDPQGGAIGGGRSAPRRPPAPPLRRRRPGAGRRGSSDGVSAASSAAQSRRPSGPRVAVTVDPLEANAAHGDPTPKQGPGGRVDLDVVGLDQGSALGGGEDHPPGREARQRIELQGADLQGAALQPPTRRGLDLPRRPPVARLGAEPGRAHGRADDGGQQHRSHPDGDAAGPPNEGSARAGRGWNGSDHDTHPIVGGCARKLHSLHMPSTHRAPRLSRGGSR